jgi:hypothetical protein
MEAQLKISRSRTILTILAVLTILTVIPASAARPDIIRFEEEFSYQVQCDGFQLDGAGTDKYRVAVFYDQEGNPVRTQVQIRYDGTLTHSLTGQTWRDPQYAMVQSDLLKGTDTFVGLIYNITVPGTGLVYIDAGRIVFNSEGNVIFEAGPHQFLNGSDQLLCAALG